MNITREERQPHDLHEHARVGWRVYSRPAPYRWELAEDGRDTELAIEARVDTNEMSVMVRLALEGSVSRRGSASRGREGGRVRARGLEAIRALSR